MDKDKQNRKSSIAFGIALIRGLLAILLGILLIFNPDKSRFFLFNMMGLFWLANGIILLRHTHPVFGEQEDRVLGKRLSLVLGAIAFLTGLLVISRSLTEQVLPEALVIQILGAVILLTGILHLMGQFRVGRFLKLKRTTAHKFLAGFEILGGALLIYSPLDRGPIIYWTATAWALIGGGLIISDAIYRRTRVNQEPAIESIQSQSGIEQTPEFEQTDEM
jgi:uncharacterized membrane protein HdeD (DUF308 family)